MTPANYNIELYQGDNYNLNFTIQGDYSAYTHIMDIASTLEAGACIVNLDIPKVQGLQSN